MEIKEWNVSQVLKHLKIILCLSRAGDLLTPLGAPAPSLGSWGNPGGYGALITLLLAPSHLTSGPHLPLTSVFSNVGTGGSLEGAEGPRTIFFCEPLSRPPLR